MKYSEIKKKYKRANFHAAVFSAIAILIFAFAAHAQTTFVQQAKLTAADGAAQDSHGFSVAISGDTAVVGAPRNSGGTGLQSRGAAYVYVRNGAGEWTPQQKLTPSDGAANDQFGYAVAVNGSTIAVGRQNTTTGLNRADGKVYIFTRSGTVWTETQTLISNDLAQGDLFGNSLAFENDTLVVGALNKTAGANFFQGAAYVFTRSNGAGNFTQQAKLTASDGVFADFFGYSVAISGDSVIVGATSLAGQPNSKGKAYVFTRAGSAWSEQSILQASDGASGDAFGFSVGISGGTAVVGARLDDVGATGDQGSVYVFTRSGSAWTETQHLFGVETTQRNDTFGGSVAIRGDTIVVGAPAHEFVGSIANHGAVYVFRRSGGSGVFGRTDKLLHDDPNPDALGTSVAFDGESIISGASSKDSARGAAYIFNRTSSPAFDFDGDGKADLSVFRPTERNWYFSLSTSGFGAVQFGLAGDKFVPADYDGDGRTDIAVWREGAGGRFYILQSSNGAVREEDFGIAGDDPAFTGDWDGDGRADLAVYRASTNHFYFRGSLNNPSGNITYLPWGAAGDLPQRGDFDGDGRQDAAIFRPSEGRWYIRQSSNGAARYENWGLASDKFVPADYDGDGKSDLAVFRNGTWYILQSSTNQPRYESFGLSTDALAPADYDGDGKADVAVFRGGVWYILQSSNSQIVYRNFGAAGDVSIASAFVQ